MNTNIEISNINNHFFLNKINNEENNRKYNTKLVEYCFYSINEGNISDNIKKIPYYSNNYLIVDDYDFVNINQLNSKYFEKVNTKNNKRYLIFKYKNEKIINFNDFLNTFRDPKEFILNIIDSFFYLLNSLIKLEDENICFFNLSPENIIFNLDCGEKPFLINFQLSLQVLKLNEEYISNIIKKLDNYTHKPLEVHILFYLIRNDISYISYSFIEEISEVFVKKNSILNLFSEKYKEFYKTSCIESLKKYINKSKNYVIIDILKQNNKWDVYSLSVIYFHIFGNISRVFSLKQNFITKIINELLINLSPEPSKRNCLENLYKNVSNLLNNEKDWSFIKKLAPEKMTNLFHILNK